MTTPSNPTTFPPKGTILREPELDDLVYALIARARDQGLIPICGVVSERRLDGTHEVRGYGGNFLRHGRSL